MLTFFGHFASELSSLVQRAVDLILMFEEQRSDYFGVDEVGSIGRDWQEAPDEENTLEIKVDLNRDLTKVSDRFITLTNQ